MAFLLPPQRILTAAQVGDFLKSARKQSNLTQSDLGLRLGLSQNRISYLELHPEELSLKQFLMWTSVVGLDLSVSLRDTADPATDAEW